MRIGIFGGAFDPIHNGHLALAHAAVKELSLDQIFFVPSCESPLKKPKSKSASAALRYQMVEESIREIPKFKISDIETTRGGVSYTIDTIREFKAQFPKPHELFFLVGGDWGSRLNEWKNMGEILSLSTFIVAARPGFQKIDLPPSIRYLNFVPLDISGSQIRDRIHSQKSVDTLVPKPTLEIIKKHNLYKD